MTVSLDFFKQYHSSIFKVLGDDSKKINAKVGSLMADKWLAQVHGDLNDPHVFQQDLEGFLYDLDFAKEVKVSTDSNNLEIAIKGCAICHGNEILRSEGLQTACPIVQTAKYSIVKGLNKNVLMKGVDKPGVVGECIIRFELQ